ncbi:MAG TPA: DUF885 family protein [Oleiagrimonas sp.]|nr:DUF885 family protein [Oleiagrimonas sp.]
MKHKLLTTAISLSLALALAGCGGPSTDAGAPGSASTTAAATQQPATDKAAKLKQVYADYWEANLKLHPLLATFQGDPRYNDKLPNMLSADYRQRQHDFTTKWLKKVQSIGSDGLSGHALISYKIFVREAKQQLESEQFPGWMQPINQFYNLAGTVVQMGSGKSAQPFKTVDDYADWRKRASQVPVLFDQAIANMKQGVKADVVQPTILMKRVVDQLDALIKDDPEKTLFWKPVANMPESFSEADRKRITDNYRKLIEDKLMPAYRELRQYIADDYMQHTRESSGMEGLPNGQAWYAFKVRQRTTTDLTPAQIHQIGLDAVKQIHGQMHEVMEKVGFKGSLHEFFDYMQTDPKFSFESKEQLLTYYRNLEAKVMKGVPKLFSKVPKADFEIRPVPEFREKSAAGGSYRGPSADGSRPGVFFVNTYDLPTRKIWDAEDLFLHEAIPGHHFQIALQREMKDLPAFRRFGGQTAFIEGWGLYAESLGKDLGVYESPYSYFGYLQNKLWRAIRLVTDTGLHSMGWSREKVIDYMLANSAESKSQATAEAERYMAIPGQALAYMIGARKIRMLREKAKKELGDKFDIRAYHSVVLGDGSLPLDILEGKVDRWIAEQKA